VSQHPSAGAPSQVPNVLWDRWLQTALIAVIVYSALLLLDGRAAGELFALLGFGMPSDALPPEGPAEQHLLLVYGVLGAVLIGWMTTLLMLARGPLRARNRWGWTTFACSFALWFVVDTTFSLAIGSPAHALFNLAFVLAVAPPLVAMRTEIPPARSNVPENHT
jgi:hypothetical protein